MSQYVWNGGDLNNLLVLPAAVADCLPRAGAEQLRVLLWFSRCGQDFDAAACAAALGMSEQECVGCLNYWVEQGILRSADAVATPVIAEPTQKAARPTAVKPVWKEVVAYQQEHKEFNAFLQEVSARLGRPLNHGDNATLLYLITTAGVPQTSVLLAAAYAVSIGKASMRYIESLVLGWADEDIVTPEQVDLKIRELTETRAAADKVEKILSLVRPLNAAQAKLAHKWLTVWCFSDAMLQHAQTLTLENCDKFSPAYMDKILERWHAEGIHSPDRIEAPKAKKKGPASTNPEQSSLDSDFEQQLLKYRPKFNKKD
ncbi:MAG: DnaD domain protein [Clostridia bacterium]|nr:DnaD domain protein [Clostridia bacterium]